MPLITQKYGKDKVRLVKVSNLPTDNEAPHLKHQHISELTVRVLLMGKAFEPSYAVADNSLVVPTDTVKNTIYYLAKRSTETLETLELFAHTLATHFLSTYSHVDGVDVLIHSHNWSRLHTTTFTPTGTAGHPGTSVDGRGDSLFAPTGPVRTLPHPHAFYRGGDEKRLTHLIAERLPNNSARFTTKSGLTDLLVLKTTGSSFERFHRDALTTLQDAPDRIFSTSVEASWAFPAVVEPLPASAVLDHAKQPSAFTAVNYDAVFRGVKQVTVDVFANHDSPSVQNTLYRMGEHILGVFPEVAEVSYALPNKHVFGYDLDRFGLKNTGKDQNVYFPVTDPSGLITATIGRVKPKL
ncbi:hypothetical protein HDU96_000635 [Phlyctochytrium bullatum]|nr:hypothetical protein HDU96_000635 [Phlyctochytrium bullatum]